VVKGFGRRPVVTYPRALRAGVRSSWVTGPGSPSVLSNMIVSIEQHVDWIADCIADLMERGGRTIEATLEAEEGWVAHVNEVGSKTLYPRANRDHRDVVAIERRVVVGIDAHPLVPSG
jgi:cation diffusion facilitator CzcD-associated flavoprotein CzcO